MIPGEGLDVFPLLNCRADVVSCCVGEVGDFLALVIENFLVKIVCGGTESVIVFLSWVSMVMQKSWLALRVESLKNSLHGGCRVFRVGVDSIFLDYLVSLVVSGDTADVSEILPGLAEHLRSGFGAHVEAWLEGVGR